MSSTRLVWAIVAAGFALSMILDVACPRHVTDLFAAQVEPGTWIAAEGQPTVLVLDAPRSTYADWSLLVRVGNTEFAIPRAELRKLAVGHPEWRKQ
jgi:hypothetical protein